MPAEKLNRYTCRTCGGSIVTVEREPGVTPMFLNCRATQGCKGGMVSAMYQDVEGEPAFEWYKPVGKEYRKLSPDMRRHIDLGGLALREIPEAAHAR